MLRKCNSCGGTNDPNAENCGVCHADMADSGYTPAPQRNDLADFPPYLFAWWLLVPGCAIAAYALFFFDNTVATSPDLSNEYMPSRVVNADLMHRQLMIFIGGCLMMMTGIVMLAMSSLWKSLNRIFCA